MLFLLLGLIRNKPPCVFRPSSPACYARGEATPACSYCGITKSIPARTLSGSESLSLLASKIFMYLLASP
jgi:hypothetical protein